MGTDEPGGLCSIDIGCVRLTEQYLHSDPPTAEELSQAVSVVRDQLADVDRLVPGAAARDTLIGTAGTVWTLGAVELGVDPAGSDLIDQFRLTPGRGRGGVPHPRHRADQPTPPQSRARPGPGRRDRRRRASWP